jgi:hypothetical protein
MKRSLRKPWGYMARQARAKRPRATPAAGPRDAATPRGDASPPAGRAHAWLLVVAGVVCLLPPLLRLLGVVGWSWAVVLAPFTAIGAAAAVAVTAVVYRDQLGSVRTRFFGARELAVGATPPPDRLEPPQAAAEAGEPILAEHPEILAALCHGFRMKHLMPSVLGQSVADPWGVYQAALAAPAADLVALRMLAKLHTARLAGARRKRGGRASDAAAMRSALDAFRPCAQKAEAGRGHPDCPFEHVTVVFGAESPNRDANLRSVAPRVRTLLERQYPQLETARLADGSQVKFVDWQKKASQDRAELTRLCKELERRAGTVDQLRAQLAEGEARIQALEDAAERQRRDAQEDARAEQVRLVADLRATIERASREHAREVERLEAEIAKLAASNRDLAAAHDAMERAMLSASAGDDDPDPAPASDLTGVRVLLVGGEPRQIAPLRERLESLGAQLLHDDGVAAAQHVGHVHVVVFWIRYLSHPTYFGVRQTVRALEAPHCYWGRTSPGSLAALVTQTMAGAQARVGEPPAAGGDAAATESV